jgi:hypothetical protein
MLDNAKDERKPLILVTSGVNWGGGGSKELSLFSVLTSNLTSRVVDNAF